MLFENRNEKVTFLVGELIFRVIFVHPHAKLKENVHRGKPAQTIIRGGTVR